MFLRSHFMLAWKCVCSSVFQLLSFWCFSVWFLMSAHRLPDCLFSSFLFYLLWYFAIILSFSVRLCVRMYKPICSVLLLLLFSFFASQLFLIRICCLLLPSLFSHRLSIQFYLFMMFSFSFLFFEIFSLKTHLCDMLHIDQNKFYCKTEKKKNEEEMHVSFVPRANTHAGYNINQQFI